ncbi:hypothetical protein GMSM_35710 [Geomonas sp. Red276]
MMLFVADYPGPHNEKDGMMQRIAAIDNRFSSVNRSYLKVSLVGNLKAGKERRSELLTIYRLNLFLHLPLILYLALTARCIYVHSVGNALAILPLYIFRRCVTDMHGVVPDEFQMAGRRLAAWRYRLVERVAVKNSLAIVTVSGAMADHYLRKYGIPRDRVVNVPIFDEAGAVPRRESTGNAPLVVYAGGTQAWQNVDLMVSTIKEVGARCRFLILTGDVTGFREKLSDHSTSEIEIKSVPKKEVYCYYAQADLGFVLRDDDLVNRVACPTKLVEYLSCGVIPIVIQPAIGDFDTFGYCYLTLADFLHQELPSPERLEEMREKNYRVIEEMKSSALSEMQRLVNLCMLSGPVNHAA